MTSASDTPVVLALLEEYPSPTKREKLIDQIEELRSALATPPKGLDINKAKIKLSDLLVGRAGPGDYSEAGKLYDEILSNSLAGEAENSKAVLGRAELSLPSSNPEEVNRAIEAAATAVDSLEDREDCFFFFIKGKLLLAELLLKRGDGEGRDFALKLYDEILSSNQSHKYFKLRALVGKLELLNYFNKDALKQGADEHIAQMQDLLSATKKDRAGDYFSLKGMIVLSEILLWKDKEHMGENARKMLSDVINDDASCDDLRARASLDLAEISSPPLAKTLIKGVRRMDGLDPYLLRKAKAIENAL